MKNTEERKKPLQKHVIMSKRNYILNTNTLGPGNLIVHNVRTRKHKHLFLYQIRFGIEINFIMIRFDSDSSDLNLIRSYF